MKRGRKPLDPEARRSRTVAVKLQPGEALMLRALAHRERKTMAELIRTWIENSWDNDVLEAYEWHVRALPRDRKPWRRRPA